MPDLSRGAELGPLPDRAKPQRIERRIDLCGRINRRATIGAETVGALVPALGGLDVDAGFPFKESEAARGYGYTDTIGRPAQGLAIRAMADHRCVRIRFSFKRDLAAMTTALDFHLLDQL